MTSADCVVTIQPGEPPLIVLAGEVNYESAPQIGEALDKLQKKGLSCLALDCGAVDFIDSSGIGAIVHWAQRLRRMGGSLTLRAATPQLIHALQVSGFADQFGLEMPPREAPEVRRMPSAGVWQRAKLSIPLQADRDGLVRKRVTDLALAMPFTQQQIDDIRLAVGEAVSNAIRHGCPNKDSDRLDVSCVGDPEKLVITVHNPGQPFDPSAVPTPDPEDPREGGMGIFFMKVSMDEVKYSFDETGTTVTMVKYIRPNSSENDNRSNLDS